MPCTNQIKAQRYGFTKDGKANYVFPNHTNYNKNREPDKLFGCKQCMPCRIQKSGEWAVRLMHEAQMHESNIFLTLTQNQEHMPKNRSLDHREIQLFLKRLRKHYEPKIIRFYLGGELGKSRLNPHWHIIVFNLEVDDLELHCRNKRGDKIYKSATIEKIWGRGFITIGEVNKTTCAYTAGYLMKDSEMNHQDTVNLVDQVTGEIIERKKPYNAMSTKPGIAKAWYDKYKDDVFPCDYVIVKGKKVNTPGYYRRQLEKDNPELFEDLREIRDQSRQTKQFLENNTPRRIRDRAKIQLLNIKRLQLEKML